MPHQIQPFTLQPQVAAAEQLAAGALRHRIRVDIQLRIAEQRPAIRKLAVIYRQGARLSGALVGEGGAGQRCAVGNPGAAAVGGVSGVEDQIGGLQPATAGVLRRIQRETRAREQFTVVTRLAGGLQEGLAAPLNQPVIQKRRGRHRQPLTADNLPACIVGERAAQREGRAVIPLQTPAVSQRAGGDTERGPLDLACVSDGGGIEI